MRWIDRIKQAIYKIEQEMVQEALEQNQQVSIGLAQELQASPNWRYLPKNVQERTLECIAVEAQQEEK